MVSINFPTFRILAALSLAVSFSLGCNFLFHFGLLLFIVELLVIYSGFLVLLVLGHQV